MNEIDDPSSSSSSSLACSDHQRKETGDINGVSTPHFFIRGHTPQVGSAPPDQRWTEYKCQRCQTKFRHYYNMTPNISEAMRKEGVPKKCMLIQKMDYR
jgi:hypothetical protein